MKTNQTFTVEMTLQNKKIEPTKQLPETANDFWNDLPEHVKAGIERGRKQTDEGKLTPHDEVMKKYAKYFIM
jgi:hypothetical protein